MLSHLMRQSSDGTEILRRDKNPENTVAAIIKDNSHLSIRAIKDQLPNDSKCEDDDL